MSWWDDQRLETDFTRGALGIEIVSDVIDQPSSQRVYGSPVYDREGNLRCRSCGAPLTRTSGRHGEGLASCNDTGCAAHGFEFLEGSFTANPNRWRR